MRCGCDRPITVRPVCGGRQICLSPWLAVIVVLVFMLVLFGRCHAVSKGCVTDVSRETIETTVTTAVEYINARFT